MSWLCLISTATRTAAPPRLPTSPKTSPRSIRRMSGIFDNSGAGEAMFPVSPVQPLLKKEADEDLSTVNVADLFALLEDAPATSPARDLLKGEGESQFLEDFINLNDFLFSGGQTPVDMIQSTVAPLPTVPQTSPLVEAESSTLTSSVNSLTSSINSGCTSTETMSSSTSSVRESGRKRTARQAGLVLPSTSTNTDHDDYVAKKPRRATAARGKATSDTNTSKEVKYRERRDKNNIASKRSREIRKQKFTAMEQKAHELEASNMELEERIVELERLTKTMKGILVERLSKTQ